LLESFTARMPLLMTTSAFGLGRRRSSSPQQCVSKLSPYLKLTCVMTRVMVKKMVEWLRYDDTRCYFNVRSKADISQLNLPHGTDN